MIMEPSFETPDNFQQKCLCVLLLDVSGSMRKPISEGSAITRLDKLNEALASFYDDIIHGKGGVAKTTKGQLEVAIVSFDQSPKLIRAPKLLSQAEKPPVLTERGSTTNTVKALDYAIDQVINSRKRFYDQTGMSYYRPWIVLLTDGNPTSSDEEIQRMHTKLCEMVKNKHLSIIGVGIGDKVSMEKLNQVSANHGTMLEGMKFGKFFRWLSNSLSTITKSNEDDTIDISKDLDTWMKGYQV
jgi:uncharacterized protein YegL